MTDRLHEAVVAVVTLGGPTSVDRALKYREIVEAARRHCADPWDNDVRLKLRALLPEPDGRES